MAVEASPAEKPVRDVAAAVIQDEAGRVLLLQRGPTAPTFPDHWGVVTGYVDPGETPAQAALREIAEELNVTGRVLRAGAPFLVDIGRANVRVWPFLCALDEPGAIRLADENRRFTWASVPEALARPIVPQLDQDFRALGLL